MPRNETAADKGAMWEGERRANEQAEQRHATTRQYDLLGRPMNRMLGDPEVGEHLGEGWKFDGEKWVRVSE